MTGTAPWWRVFPWDPAAGEGAPYSVRYTPPGAQTGGRFDLGKPAVVYLGSHPEHAVAEVMQEYRGKPLRDGHFLKPAHGRPGLYVRRALVEARIPPELEGRILELDDGAALDGIGHRPGDLASHVRQRSRPVARRVYDDGARYAGFRWWSALTGEWNTLVLFADRVDAARLGYGEPEPLHPGHPHVRAAARFLRMA